MTKYQIRTFAYILSVVQTFIAIEHFCHVQLVKRAISGILFAIRFLVGLYVEKKAHRIEAVNMKMNSFFGNVNGVGIPTNIDL